MNTSPKFKVSLDRDRHVAFTQRALFRMGTLPAPFEFGDLSKPRKSYAALVAWTWACLVPEDAADFQSPEDLAAHIPAKSDVCLKLASTLADAINAGTGEPKNAGGSTPASSPASSST